MTVVVATHGSIFRLSERTAIGGCNTAGHLSLNRSLGRACRQQTYPLTGVLQDTGGRQLNWNRPDFTLGKLNYIVLCACAHASTAHEYICPLRTSTFFLAHEVAAKQFVGIHRSGNRGPCRFRVHVRRFPLVTASHAGMHRTAANGSNKNNASTAARSMAPMKLRAAQAGPGNNFRDWPIFEDLLPRRLTRSQTVGHLVYEDDVVQDPSPF